MGRKQEVRDSKKASSGQTGRQRRSRRVHPQLSGVRNRRMIKRNGKAANGWEVESELSMTNTPVHSRMVCWSSTSTSASVSFIDSTFNNMMCCSINGSTSSTPIINSYRIRHVRLIGLGDGTGNSVVDFTWGNDNGPDKTHSLAFGPTDPVECVLTPDPMSEVARWKDLNGVTGTESMFEMDLSGLAGTVYLKIYFDLVYSYDTRGGSGPTCASATDGIWYPPIPLASSTFTAVGDVSVA